MAVPSGPSGTRNRKSLTELFAGAPALMVLDLARVAEPATWGFRPADYLLLSRIQPPLVSPSRFTGVCKSQGQKARTGLRFELKGLRSGCVAALLAAHHGKEFPSLSPGRGIHESPAGLSGIS